MICDGERVAIAPVAEFELALEVRAPQFIRLGGARERRALGPVTSSGSPLGDLGVAGKVLKSSERTGDAGGDVRSETAVLRALDHKGFFMKVRTKGGLAFIGFIEDKIPGSLVPLANRGSTFILVRNKIAVLVAGSTVSRPEPNAAPAAHRREASERLLTKRANQSH